MKVFNKPRFIGQHLDSDSRYEHFVNYATNFDLGGDVAGIYAQNFRSQVDNYMKTAQNSREDLVQLEEKLASVKQKKNLTAAGLIAQEDARNYVLEALIYSREAVLSRVKIHG